jgi:hypothetical protein
VALGLHLRWLLVSRRLEILLLFYNFFWVVGPFVSFYFFLGARL